MSFTQFELRAVDGTLSLVGIEQTVFTISEQTYALDTSDVNALMSGLSDHFQQNFPTPTFFSEQDPIVFKLVAVQVDDDGSVLEYDHAHEQTFTQAQWDAVEEKWSSDTQQVLDEVYAGLGYAEAGIYPDDEELENDPELSAIVAAFYASPIAPPAIQAGPGGGETLPAFEMLGVATAAASL